MRILGSRLFDKKEIAMFKKEKIPPTTKRVRLNTSDNLNKKIKDRTIDNIEKYKNVDEEALTNRLRVLNKEWNTERVLEANASTLILISTILGLRKNRNWFILTKLVSFFLLQHAVQGWCPPLPVIRRLGIRTPEEISNEKTAVKYLRGDFSFKSNYPVEILEMIRKD